MSEPVHIQPVWGRVAQIKATIENVDLPSAKAEIESGAQDLLLIDIRELQELVDSGAIPGSKHVPRGMLEFWADPASEYYRSYFTPEKRILLYCAGGGRSALATRALLDMGFPNVAHIEAGFTGWKQAGYDVQDVASTSRWVRREKA